MRLSYISPFSQATHRRNAVAYARLAEDLGYDGVWLPEAFGSDAFTLLGLIAGRTTRLKLATGIVNIYSRSPTLLAQSFATLDEISDGRAVIGLGASGPVVIENWHGMAFDRPLTRTREVVEILRLALAGERVDYQGECFRLNGFRLLIRPVQRSLPIYLATLKPRAVRQTGRIADGWLPTHVSLRNLAKLRRPLIDGARSANRPPDSIDMAAMTLAVATEDGAAARALCREHLAYYVGGMGIFYHELLHGYGYGDVADNVVAAWKRGARDAAAEAIPDEVLDDLVIAGTTPECLDAVEARRRAGLEHIVVFPPHGASPEQVSGTLEALAPAIG
ncbi:MAG: LLM class flavin-dependent oxidoreductase [Alphaproteobacteria bacterium]|jgi:coenzyme F420-dependent oxidoreductase|nr:LLM class flavin-dependent oxidoreductase [Alphaproteobacteria bacterium]MDP6815370.1 LLM class flavin-dependent oxidoreductase [Alphaproteobacteria bacterium]